MRTLVLIFGLLLLSTVSFAQHAKIQFSGKPYATVYEVEFIETYYLLCNGEYIPLADIKSLSNISAGLVGGPKWVITLKDGSYLFPQSSVVFYRKLLDGYSPVLKDYESAGMLIVVNKGIREEGAIREVEDPNKTYELTILE